MRQQPKTRGVQRKSLKSYMHEEVAANLQSIADAEGKTFSWVVADIVYAHFGLKIDENIVKVIRRRYRRRRR